MTESQKPILQEVQWEEFVPGVLTGASVAKPSTFPVSVTHFPKPSLFCSAGLALTSLSPCSEKLPLRFFAETSQLARLPLSEAPWRHLSFSTFAPLTKCGAGWLGPVQ
ncbi:unnamed protein product [Eretmochelys imbricata]